MPQEAINQIRNPSFELYIDPTTLLPFSGWQITRRSGGSNTTTTDISAYIVNTKAWAGINSVYTANVVGSDFVTLRYDSLSIETGKYYAFSFYVYGAPRSSGRLYTATVSSGGVARGRKAFNIIENQWQRIEVVFYSSVTSSSVSASIGKEIVGSSYAGGDVYIDAVQFEQLNTVDADIGLPTPANMHATTYFDGDTVGYIGLSLGDRVPRPPAAEFITYRMNSVSTWWEWPRLGLISHKCKQSHLIHKMAAHCKISLIRLEPSHLLGKFMGKTR
jgi:hypothetical protein